MRTVAAGQSAQPGNVTPRVWIANSSDVLVDLTTSGVVVEYDDPSADAPIGAATITFRRGEGVSSLAPLMTASPPIDLNRRVMVEVPVGGGVYKEVFRGAIDSVRWPERFGDLVIECRDQARNFADTRIETIRAYGSAAGVALETVAQSVADDNLATSPTIYVPTATGAVVVTAEGAEPYKPSESVYESVKHLADSIGWAARYRYIDSLSDWRFTLFEPSRTKTVADHTFADTAYFDVSMMEQDIEDIRNVIVVEYSDADGVRQTVTVSDSTSITKYGRRYAKISEASDSPIDTEAKATQLANAALSDLKEPDAVLEVRCPYFWPGEVGVDLYTFTANNVHFSSDQTLAPVSIRHRIAVGERSESRIVCRGNPTGGVLTWRKRAQPPKGGAQYEDKPETKLLQNFRARDSADGLSEVITWTNGAKLEEVWIATRTVEGVVTAADWTALAAAVESKGLISTYTVTKPTETDGTARTTLIQIEGTYTDAATGNLVTSDAWVRTIRPKVAIAAIEPATGNLVAGAVTTTTIADGTVTTVKLGDSSVTTTKLSDSSVTEAKIGSASVTTTKLGAESVTEAKIGASAVTSTKLADGVVTQVKMGTGLRVPEILGALPAAGSQGRLVFLTTDNKLYRDTGTAWTVAVPTSDLSGTITSTQITDGAISTPKLAANAVTAAKIAAGTITANEIAADTIVAGNIAAGAIGATEIAAGAVVAGKIAADAVTASEIAAGTITSAEIAADTITAANIAAGAIGVGELAADSVTAAKLSAVAIETGKYIRSTTYTAGSAGWNIAADGSAEFNNVTVRGTLDGVTGTFSGALAASTIDTQGTLQIDIAARSYVESPGLKWISGANAARVSSGNAIDIELRPNSGGHVDFQNMGTLPTGKISSGNYLPVKVGGTVFYLELFS